MSYEAAELFVRDCRMDVYDTQSIDDVETRICAAVYHESDPVVTSDWEEIDIPGDEDSYDTALYSACNDAEGKLVGYLMSRFEIEQDDAQDLVDLLSRSDMPVS